MMVSVMRAWSLLGTPSITLLVLAADLLLRRFTRRALFTTAERRTLLAIALLLAVVLYASTLGFVDVDVYRAGFTVWAPIVLASIAIVVARQSFALACTALAVLLAFAVPLFASVNLFDYVIDPILGLIALGWALVRGVAGLSGLRTED